MKKSQAIGTRISTKQFDFGPNTMTFFTYIAELSAEHLDPLDRLWADEGTKGFVLVSHKTGDEYPFQLDHTEREADGDVRAWRFVPHPHAIAQNKYMSGISVVIYNT
jgi:hypothetical protein